MQIKQMNRLESTAFYIDTIIRTEKKKGIGAGFGRILKAVFFYCARQGVGQFGFGQIRRGQCQYCRRQGLNQLAGGGNFERGFGKYQCTIFKPARLISSMDKSVFKTVQEEARRQVFPSACKAEIFLGIPTVRRKCSWKTCLH